MPGLTRCADGRWRIAATEERFTEQDEHRAVAKAKLIIERHTKQDKLWLTSGVKTTDAELKAAGGNPIAAAHAKLNNYVHGDYDYRIDQHPDGRVTASQFVEPMILFPWLRNQLHAHRNYIADQVAMPELKLLGSFGVAKPSIRVEHVITSYEEHSTGTPKSKQEAVSKFSDLVEFAKAKTLDDLTDQKLLDYRAKVVSDPALKSSDSIVAYFNRIRSVIRIAGRGLDAAQIDVAVARCRAKLYPPKNNVEDDPHPISRKNFRCLLDGVEKTNIAEVWRAMLLLGMNCALYMEDLCDLKWEHLKLDEGVYIARRKKRGRCLRAAVLWPKTVAAVRAIRRGGSPYVFVSNRGTRYNKNTKINDFKDFTTKVGVSGVTFSHVRDGAYTAACNAKRVKDRYAELLAGHATGMKDKYVLRKPRVVLPATRAVYRRYFGERRISRPAPCPQGGEEVTVHDASSVLAGGCVSETPSETRVEPL